MTLTGPKLRYRRLARVRLRPVCLFSCSPGYGKNLLLACKRRMYFGLIAAIYTAHQMIRAIAYWKCTVEPPLLPLGYREDQVVVQLNHHRIRDHFSNLLDRSHHRGLQQAVDWEVRATQGLRCPRHRGLLLEVLRDRPLRFVLILAIELAAQALLLLELFVLLRTTVKPFSVLHPLLIEPATKFVGLALLLHFRSGRSGRGRPRIHLQNSGSICICWFRTGCSTEASQHAHRRSRFGFRASLAGHRAGGQPQKK